MLQFFVVDQEIGKWNFPLEGGRIGKMNGKAFLRERDIFPIALRSNEWESWLLGPAGGNFTDRFTGRFAQGIPQIRSRRV